MRIRRLAKGKGPDDDPGYVLLIVLLVLVVAGMMVVTLGTVILANQQHVSRDRAYSQSLAVAEAGLNQYLWMVAAGKSSEANDFAIPGNTGPNVHKQTLVLADADAAVKGTYTLLVAPPSDIDSRITATITGIADSTTDVARTVKAHIGRPSFCEYILLVNDSVYIGGPLDRVWHGKTHSNTGVRIETANITDTVTCARATYTFSGLTKPGVWSADVPATDWSRSLWSFPVPVVDFNTVTSDFVRLSSKAIGVHNLPYVEPTAPGAAHGWYIKLLPRETYQVAQVTGEVESKNYSNGNKNGGYLIHGTLSSARPYPDKGVIYVNDNVWVEGAELDGRLTIACSGQLNAPGKTAATSINIVGDLKYSAKDGTVVLGLIAQNNVKIPMYAPMGKEPPLTKVDMEVNAAIIAQQGAEYVSFDSSGSSNGWGPRRHLLTIYGSIASYGTPYRRTGDLGNSSDHAGFYYGANTYDEFLLHNPPPFFPTIGSYQILDWQELPASQAVWAY